ncbi:MAG: HAD family hydrolase [Cyanobacteriota bacterium]|jgi:phosphoglycolate phosphatase-like HAD superfamily hydrolase
MTPKILALDFDGVLCNGLAEYFHSAAGVYRELWPQDGAVNLDPYQEGFTRLRPVIETGWEMPLLLRALVLNTPEAVIEGQWPEVKAQLLAEDNLKPADLAQALDQTRDRWIETDLKDWLALHQFYPGVIPRLKMLLEEYHLYIVTTKEGRFIQALLQGQGIALNPGAVFGKECRQPKAETLRQLLARHGCNPVELWFVEDLLPTLAKVAAAPNLTGAGLFLADWGYNTPAVRAQVTPESPYRLLSLPQFQGPLSLW